MAQIATAAALRKAQKTLDEADQINNQVIQLATQTVQIAKSYAKLQSLAEDEEDSGVFSERFGKAVTAARSQLAGLPAPERALAKSFIDAIFAE